MATGTADTPSLRAPLAVSSLGVRGCAVVLAVIASVVQPSASPVLVVIAMIAALASVSAPGAAGALPVLVVELVAWIYGDGTDVDISVWRSVPFAVVLYLIHLTVALAAVADVRTAVSMPVLRRWARNAVPGTAAAVFAGTVVAVLDTPAESVVLDVVAVAVVGLALAVIVRLAR